MDRENIHRILIRGTNWIGDALMTTPAIAAIRKGFPKAHITLWVIPSVVPVFQENPDIDEIRVYDRGGRHAGFRGKLRLIRSLREARFDLSILLQNAFDAAFIAWAARIPWRYGYNTDGRGILLKPSIPLSGNVLGKHQVDYYLHLLKPLLKDEIQTSEEAGASTPRLRLYLSKEENEKIEKDRRKMGIGEEDPIIGIHPGATYGTAKRWPPDRFAELIRVLVRRHQAKIVLFGGPGEEPAALEILQRIGDPALPVWNLSGKTSVRELMAWIGQCRLLVSNDSGPMHIAAALGVPVTAIFGPTNPVTTGPFGRGHLLIRKEVSCSPCLLRECPTDHQCMQGILVDDVMAGVDRILSADLWTRGMEKKTEGAVALRSAVFLDRDGTINEELGYVATKDRFRLLPGVEEAIRSLNESGLKTFIVTNQSGIGRGYYSEGAVGEIHTHLHNLLAQKGGRVDGIYICPHSPEARCRCRKPEPGMILQAVLEHGIDPFRSYVVGDKAADMVMARRSGARGVLVLTGYGAEELKRTSGEVSSQPTQVAQNLLEAVRWITGEVENLGFHRRGSSERKRILMIKPSSLGDILHGLPVLAALREHWPRARITWVVKELWSDILQGHPDIDELVLLKENSLTSGIRAFRKRLRQGRYDLAIDLQGLFRSGWIAYLSGAPMRLGFANAREMASTFYTHRLEVPRERHAVERNLELVTVLGWKPSERFQDPGLLPFPLFVGQETSLRVSDFLNHSLKREGPLIVMLPGSRWDKKRWPSLNFAHLGTLLNQELKADIILLGSSREAPLIQDIRRSLTGPSLSVTDFSLREMVSLLSRADLLVTNDSGPMHVAAALGTPVVALFGPTDPGRTGPYRPTARVIQKQMDCSPCFRKPCIHDRFVCMESISVEEVLAEVRDLLRNHEVNR